MTDKLSSLHNQLNYAVRMVPQGRSFLNMGEWGVIGEWCGEEIQQYKVIRRRNSSAKQYWERIIKLLLNETLLAVCQVLTIHLLKSNLNTKVQNLPMKWNKNTQQTLSQICCKINLPTKLSTLFITIVFNFTTPRNNSSAEIWRVR